METRTAIEQLLRDRGWKKGTAAGGWPEHSWFKPPIASTHCEETSLLGAVRRQLQLEDDFGTEGWRGATERTTEGEG